MGIENLSIESPSDFNKKMETIKQSVNVSEKKKYTRFR